MFACLFVCLFVVIHILFTCCCCYIYSCCCYCYCYCWWCCYRKYFEFLPKHICNAQPTITKTSRLVLCFATFEPMLLQFHSTFVWKELSNSDLKSYCYYCYYCCCCFCYFCYCCCYYLLWLVICYCCYLLIYLVWFW